MRRWAIITAAAALLLSGCAGKETARSVSEQRTLTVVLWDYDKESYDRHLVEAFEECHPGVRVNVISYPDSYYDQKMESMLIGGGEADVFYTRTSGSLYKLYKYGAAWPLDGLVESYGLDLQDDPVLDGLRCDGHLLGVPYRNDHYVLYYNCDLFDRAGIEYPDKDITWEEIPELAKKLQDHLDPGEYAMMTLPMDVQWVSSGRTGTEKLNEETADSIAPIMELLNGMQKDGTTKTYRECIAEDIQQQCFESGKYGMYVGGTWYQNYLTSDSGRGCFDFQWGVAAAPHWGTQAQAGKKSILSGVCISSRSSDKKLAYDYLKFVTGSEGAAIMAEEQMVPAFLDSKIETIYQENFAGKVLDVDLSDEKGIPDRLDENYSEIQQIYGEEFRKCVTGQETIEEACRAIRERIPVDNGS
ncbi:MAG: extracellular solute-binding protein [Lachnospiraceae bacterium]|jgi:multiple sugar transport system substrate-binding protein|nr:extracellular solute-binding protein [Lachnospiraceae bacterium]MCI1329293.1 extracellular solute-binding protein [Lachnospiraceae bacterium]